MIDLPTAPRREPILNLPAVVTGLIVVLVIIHAARMFLLDPRQDAELILVFSFIPLRYHGDVAGAVFPGGLAADIWTPVTYGLLHGDWVHLGFNAIWLAAFGSALAWRFGALRFLVFSALATAAGAGVHYLAHPQEFAPVVGASAAISGHMAAVSRFMFQAGGPLGFGRRDPRARFSAPAVSLPGILKDSRVLGFLGVWFGLNLVFGLGALPIAGEAEGVSIAWEAHVGGFLFGLLAFSLFDPIGSAREGDPLI